MFSVKIFSDNEARLKIYDTAIEGIFEKTSQKDITVFVFNYILSSFKERVNIHCIQVIIFRGSCIN